MRRLLKLLWTIYSRFKKTLDLALENLALRQQLSIMKRSSKRPQIRPRDRLFLVVLSRLWSGWQDALIVVKPDTVVRWHRKGFFKLLWRYKSRLRGPGRPPISQDVRDLILRMAKTNPLWGALSPDVS
jgi:hypothetical protein